MFPNAIRYEQSNKFCDNLMSNVDFARHIQLNANEKVLPMFHVITCHFYILYAICK